MTTTSIFLIRHAETMWNFEGRMQGFGDSSLSERGTRQSEALGRRLQKLQIDSYYSSDAMRCRRTLSIATGRPGVRTVFLPSLRERNLGDWEGRLWTEIAQEDPIAARRYKEDADFAPPNGETAHELRNRITTALVEISASHPGRRTAVITSGGGIRAAVLGLLDLSMDAWARLSAWNVGITRLEVKDERWKLLTFNDVSHLAEEVQK